MMQPGNQKIIVLSGDIHLSSHASLSYNDGAETKFIHELISSPIKQLQTNILSDTTPTSIEVGAENLRYELGKHMGYPVTNGEERIHLCNNIMSIQVNDESLTYTVYALNSKEVVFTDTIRFKD